MIPTPQYLRALKEQRSISYRELAKQSGLSLQAVHQTLNNKRDTRTSTLIALLRVLEPVQAGGAQDEQPK